MVELKWTEQALHDLDAVCLFIAKDAPMAANLFANRVFDATDRLRLFPESGRVVPEMNRLEIREIILDNYRVIYRLHAMSELVEILTVHHGARLLKLDVITNQ